MNSVGRTSDCTILRGRHRRLGNGHIEVSGPVTALETYEFKHMFCDDILLTLCCYSPKESKKREIEPEQKQENKKVKKKKLGQLGMWKHVKILYMVTIGGSYCRLCISKSLDRLCSLCFPFSRCSLVLLFPNHSPSAIFSLKRPDTMSNEQTTQLLEHYHLYSARKRQSFSLASNALVMRCNCVLE